MAQKKTRVKVTKHAPRKFVVINRGKIRTSEGKRFVFGTRISEFKDVTEHDANIYLKTGDIEEVTD